MADAPPVKRSRATIVVLSCLAIVAGAGAFLWSRQGPDPAHAARPATRPAVPVSVAIATRQDVPIYLTGLGTVQASFTVGIHSQVDGKL
ncbi:MAG: efflux RND transporter periplasmic adaptor subunit, partial [Xanthobacteraceae bacterium]